MRHPCDLACLQSFGSVPRPASDASVAACLDYRSWVIEVLFARLHQLGWSIESGGFVHDSHGPLEGHGKNALSVSTALGIWLSLTRLPIRRISIEFS